MKIQVITLFPEIFKEVLSASIIGRAARCGLVEFEFINLRDFGEGKHKVVDGRPYGGGAGMVLRADILTKALKSAKCKVKSEKSQVILTSASGKTYKQDDAQRLSKMENVIIVCGHYEGIDQRFIDKYVTEEFSIGDFVLTGGEIPAMAIIDSIVRLIPGVLKKEEATLYESFSENLLEYPQYTRPEEFEGEKVPEVLRSGNHAEIKKWQKEKSLEKTKKVRPDLLK
ncbi:tRNA (guanosine(37)-N1)-methyltransferase TrmD [Candidatus Daviesbacteria bacterium RIFOXYD1_FULL_41_10]|uniref:tRNA (guanine-N(1)-)-methyltransferase n=2 Tax=Candidatus Daviesiibacteriota TaxID=1752718 RepID=A0A1F5N2M1_9BACT|nr:MAG: tRNA (guanine-N(1)-)-methyltransferase [Candidatus Daviesbacteria bacterium GW2011_GWB1_41_5]OGE71875.1 MAG: tRNA (guanosine(37)-N1)-methyltransferase TrmD [Candidatus Daviesbacteria bacterium RIFOXYD1_FULL_41_10]